MFPNSNCFKCNVKASVILWGVWANIHKTVYVLSLISQDSTLMTLHHTVNPYILTLCFPLFQCVCRNWNLPTGNLSTVHITSTTITTFNYWLLFFFPGAAINMVLMRKIYMKSKLIWFVSIETGSRIQVDVRDFRRIFPPAQSTSVQYTITFSEYVKTSCCFR